MRVVADDNGGSWNRVACCGRVAKLASAIDVAIARLVAVVSDCDCADRVFDRLQSSLASLADHHCYFNCWISWPASACGRIWGIEVGAFCGAMVVGMGSNLYARVRKSTSPCTTDSGNHCACAWLARVSIADGVFRSSNDGRHRLCVQHDHRCGCTSGRSPYCQCPAATETDFIVATIFHHGHGPK